MSSVLIFKPSLIDSFVYMDVTYIFVDKKTIRYKVKKYFYTSSSTYH